MFLYYLIPLCESLHFTDKTTNLISRLWRATEGFVVSNGYSLQHFTGVRALNLQHVLHFTISLNNVIEIIIWKGDFLSRCPRGVFSTNWSGRLRCPSLKWAICWLPQHLLTQHKCFSIISTLFFFFFFWRAEIKRNLTFQWQLCVAFVIYTSRCCVWSRCSFFNQVGLHD